MYKSIKIIVAAIACGVIISLILLIPIKQQRIINEGVDSFEAHRALFGDHIFSQDIKVKGSIISVGFILVDLYRTENLSSVHVDIINTQNGTLYGTSTINPDEMRDDAFAYAQFASPLEAPQTVRLVLRAPDASGVNPIGVRYDPEVTSPSLPHMEDKEIRKGTFAVAIQERVPLWIALREHITKYPTLWIQTTQGVGIALLISILSCQLGWKNKPLHTKRAIELGIIISISALAFNTRMAVIPQLKGVSGGDPYNYLSITKQMMRFENPFSGEKRLPGYSLLLVPALSSPSIDDHTYMRTLSAASASGALVMLALLARSLKMPWSVLLLAPSLLAWQKDFFWTSLRPEPYTLYTFLLITLLVLFVSVTKQDSSVRYRRLKQILFGVVLGYAAMTRQEGFVAAAVLGSVFVIKIFFDLYKSRNIDRRHMLGVRGQMFLFMFLPAFIIVLPFFIHNFQTYGNPIFTPYFRGERLQIVNSWESFKDSAGASWGVTGSMWKPAWDQLERYPLSNKTAGATIILSLAWWILWQKRPDVSPRLVTFISTTAALGIFVAALLSFLARTATFNQIVPNIIAALMMVGIVPFIARTGWMGAIVASLASSQIFIALWFHPFPKHFQQSYPFITLAIAAIIGISVSRNTVEKVATLFALVFPFVLINLSLFSTLKGEIDKYNTNVATDTVIYRAIQAARFLPGPHGVDRDYQQALLYLDEKTKFMSEETLHDSNNIKQWITDNDIRTLITTNTHDVPITADPSWEEIYLTKSEGKDERMFEGRVYKLP